MLETRFVDCPYCGERIELVIDAAEPEFEYIEDCEVCCRPMIVRVEESEDGVTVSVRSEND